MVIAFDPCFLLQSAGGVEGLVLERPASSLGSILLPDCFALFPLPTNKQEKCKTEAKDFFIKITVLSNSRVDILWDETCASLTFNNFRF